MQRQRVLADDLRATISDDQPTTISLPVKVAEVRMKLQATQLNRGEQPTDLNNVTLPSTTAA